MCIRDSLSPILFAIATSDLPQAVVNGDVDVFADDINDTVVDTNPAIVVAKLQEDAKKLKIGSTPTLFAWRMGRPPLY